MTGLPVVSDSFQPDLPASDVKTRVGLVNMPFSMADRPSIQCGLLKAALLRAGHETKVHYLNLEFAAEFGAELYREVAHLRTDLLLGEWLFSVAAFGYRPNEEAYRQACPALEKTCRDADITFERLCELRNEILPAWIESWAEAVDWGHYGVVGFTSTFEQNTPSFALARAIKERYHGVVTVFGGANFDGDMGKEFVRVLPYLDYAVSGEGDRVFPQLVQRVAEGREPLGLPGVMGRNGGPDVVDNGRAPTVHDLDEVPAPDYDEYFETLFRLGRERVLGTQPPLLLFETARGCWWGEKQHCTFCGLNGNGMKFRAKSPPEALSQLEDLASKYKIVNFEAVDNIMDYKYLSKLCEPLSECKYDYKIFYEVKANLSPAQLRLMAQAGIHSIQPGIESLSSHVLKLMRKGITMLRNVRLLKWAYYYGMRVGWNILTGFPGETEEDYREQLRVMGLLRHLPPPAGGGRIWLERFSPYFFDSSFPVSDVRPLDVYGHIYPEGDVDLEEVAYFFDYRMDETLPDDFHQELREEIDEWQEAWKANAKPVLVYQRAPDWIQVIDRRRPEARAQAFSGLEADVYELCGDTDRTADAVCKLLARNNGGGAARPETVEPILESFCDQGLMLEEDGRYLSLALPVNPNW